MYECTVGMGTPPRRGGYAIRDERWVEFDHWVMTLVNPPPGNGRLDPPSEVITVSAEQLVERFVGSDGTAGEREGLLRRARELNWGGSRPVNKARWEGVA